MDLFSFFKPSATNTVLNPAAWVAEQMRLCQHTLVFPKDHNATTLLTQITSETVRQEHGLIYVQTAGNSIHIEDLEQTCRQYGRGVQFLDLRDPEKFPSEENLAENLASVIFHRGILLVLLPSLEKCNEDILARTGKRFMRCLKDALCRNLDLGSYRKNGSPWGNPDFGRPSEKHRCLLVLERVDLMTESQDSGFFEILAQMRSMGLNGVMTWHRSIPEKPSPAFYRAWANTNTKVVFYKGKIFSTTEDKFFVINNTEGA